MTAALLLFASAYLAGNPELGLMIVVFAALPAVVFARELRAMGEQ